MPPPMIRKLLGKIFTITLCCRWLFFSFCTAISCRRGGVFLLVYLYRTAATPRLAKLKNAYVHTLRTFQVVVCLLFILKDCAPGMHYFLMTTGIFNLVCGFCCLVEPDFPTLHPYHQTYSITKPQLCSKRA